MKSFLILIAIYTFSTLVVSCGTSDIKHSENSVSNVDFQSIKSGVLHGAGEEGIANGVIAVRSIQEFDDLKEKMNAVNKELEEDILPNLHFFDTEMLIFVFDKVRGTGGYTFDVEEITENNQVLKVKVLSKRPTGSATSIMTQPYHIVSTLKSDKELTLEIIE